VETPDVTAEDQGEDTGAALPMPEPYSPQMPETDAFTANAGLYDEEEDDEEEYAEDEEEEEEPEDETAGGGFASLAGTRINRDLEGRPAGSDDEWGEESGLAGGYPSGEGGHGEEVAEGDEAEDALELTTEASEPEPDAPQDELLLDADRLAEADQPSGGRRRRLLGGGSDEPESAGSPVASKPSGGSTLFERMANLSRAGTETSDEEDEEGEGSSSLRIPRFLGRQNNQ
jgi:cell division protein FtsZ